MSGSSELDKNGKVLVIEPNGSARKLIGDVLKECGFGTVEAMDTVKTAIGYLEVEHADWILAPLQMTEPVNAFHLLDILLKNPQFEGTRASLFIDDSEKIHLPAAFELGLMSWHPRVFTKDAVTADFKELFDLIAKQRDNSVLVAAEYLNQCLRDLKCHASLLGLFQSLSSYFPTHDPLILRLAEAQFLNKANDKGRQTLGVAKHRGVEGWNQVAQQFLGEPDVPPSLGIENILLVDPDETTHKQLREAFTRFPGVHVHAFVDGRAALDALASGQPFDLVLLEWKLPKISGPVFIQRVRHMGHLDLPVLVVSSLTSKQDVPLLNEMSVTGVVPKPLDEAELLKTVAYAVEQERSPSHPKTLERKIVACIASDHIAHARMFYARLQGDPAASEGQKRFVEALFAFEEDAFDAAAALVKRALQHGADQVKAIHLLGRIFAHQRDFQSAYKCLKRAQEISPKNIERLCELADVQNEMGDARGADASLAQAKDLDAQSDVVKEKEGKILISRGDVARARELLVHMGSLADLVADMNNSAVSLIRHDAFSEGVALYERTLQSLPETQIEWRMKVGYNLALAHARKNALDASLAALDRAPPDTAYPVARKMAALREKILAAQKNNSHLKLQERVTPGHSAQVAMPWEDEGTPPPSDTQAAATASASEGTSPESLPGPQPGKHCCCPFFRAIEPQLEPSRGLLANAPRFKPRSSIARAESMGVERVNN